MKGNSNNPPKAVERSGSGYLIRWNILQNNRESAMIDIIIESYDFDYNAKYMAKEVSKKEIMLSIIREKYDSDDEISIAMRREGGAEKFQEHEDYVNLAKVIAEQILSNETI